MGMFREGTNEIDIVKEMAEGLGSSGLRLEDYLDKTKEARAEVLALISQLNQSICDKDEISADYVNEAIAEHNMLVDKCEDALRWLLIQREACGFRTHKNVNIFYPMPERIKSLKNGS